MPAPQVSDFVVHVTSDGRLTIDALKVFQVWARLLDELMAEKEAHAATLADHEARITTLEP